MLCLVLPTTTPVAAAKQGRTEKNKQVRPVFLASQLLQQERKVILHPHCRCLGVLAAIAFPAMRMLGSRDTRRKNIGGISPPLSVRRSLLRLEPELEGSSQSSSVHALVPTSRCWAALSPETGRQMGDSPLFQSYFKFCFPLSICYNSLFRVLK